MGVLRMGMMLTRSSIGRPRSAAAAVAAATGVSASAARQRPLVCGGGARGAAGRAMASSMGVRGDARTGRMYRNHVQHVQTQNQEHAMRHQHNVRGASVIASAAAAAAAAEAPAKKQIASDPGAYGFEMVKELFIDEYNSRGALYRHKRTGAEVMSLCNDDENKTFGVVFRTPPDDSKGIPHILEHSVLCGSRKYPIKEPFVELIKSSMNTFLNAFTYPDRTCYPVASANLQDFYNLVDVYMDAVFFPKCVGDKMTFEQEGWHHELDSVDGEITFKGVVFNEMKGVYSNPDQVLGREIQQALFPDNAYGVDSGGDPTVIPELTFEEFQAFHSRYYHPSNARFWFYGDDDADERLKILDGYLKEFDRLEVDSAVRPQLMKTEPRKVVERYVVEESTPESERKHYMTVNWLLAEDGLSLEEQLAVGFLDQLLLGTNASPLYTRLLESGLGEALVGGGLEDELRQPTFSVGLKGVAKENTEKVEALIMDTLTQICEEGFTKDQIEAAVNTIEFRMRENNTGSFPRGLSLMLTSMTGWLYEKDPFDPLLFSKPMDALKLRLDNGEDVFRPLIKKFLLDNNHRVTVELQPDTDLSKEIEKEEKDKLAAFRGSLDVSGLESVVEQTKKLKLHQETPDPPEALNVVPSLSLSDISKEATNVPKEVTSIGGATALRHDLFTNGILYMNTAMDMRGVPEPLLPLVPLFSRCLMEMGTTSRSYVELTQEIGRKTGGISVSPFTSNAKGSDDPIAYMMVRGKCTANQVGDMTELMRDIVFNATFDDRDRFKQFVLESKSGMEAAVVGGGHSIASSRLMSQRSIASAAAERMGGLSKLFYLRELITRIDEDWDGVKADLEAIRTALLHNDGLLVNLTADEKTMTCAEASVEALLSAFPGKTATAAPWSSVFPMQNEALTVPTQVNYVGKAANLYKDAGYELSGSAYVINKYVGTTWLWDRVRVSGGAYGGFCNFDSHSGMFQYLSYRDPNLVKTVKNYDGTADFLKTLDIDQESLTKAIIGTIGDIDAYQLPDAKGATSFMRHILGVTDEERQQRRDEILSTSTKDFKNFGDVLHEAFSKSGSARVVAVTNKEGVEKAMGEDPSLNFNVVNVM